jgi:hypothetical protein
MENNGKALNKSIKAFWTNQHNSGHKGLLMLQETMQHWQQHGDWTPLARFLSLSGQDKANLWRIVQMAFGVDNVKYKMDKKADVPIRLEMPDRKDFNLAGQNGYGVLQKAIDDKKSFRSQDFLKEVRAITKPDAKAKKDKNALASLEVVYKYITGKMKDDVNLKAELTNLVRALEKRIEARKEASAGH